MRLPNRFWNKPSAKALFLILGLGLFLWFILRMHPAELWQYLRQLKANLLWILGLALVWNLLYALAWKLLLIEEGPNFWQVFRIKICGEAVNNLTPLGWGGGDPLRMWLMQRHLSGESAAASVVVDRSLNNFAAALVLCVGIAIGLWIFPLSAALRFALIASLLVILCACVGLIWYSQKGFLEGFTALLRTLRIKKRFSPKTMSYIAEVDQRIREYYHDHRGRFWAGLSLHIVARSLSAVEIYLAAHFLGSDLSFAFCYVVSALTILANLIFFFIPGGLGVLEGSFSGGFALAGLSPALGTAVQVVRRIRTLAWTVFGLIWMPRHPKEAEAKEVRHLSQ